MNHSMMAVAVIFFMADGSHLVYHSENGGWQMSVIVFLRIRAVLASVKEASIQASIQRMADRRWWMAIMVFLGILAVLVTVE